ncbi:hypothetical protein FRC04_010061 [Tulasnella sp. 424]|nr:hypothetical protein FRC04_010061 [Tulasnella sp. 424]KAG8974084.1 hypothetical protein FRC05_007832 [Tulasnella sp. 425]
MNSSLDAILATGSEAIGGYATGGYGAGGAITTETERRRSSAHCGAVVGLATQQQPLAESASAEITGTAVYPVDSFHHATAQETQDVTTTPASPSHTSPLPYHHPSNHPVHTSPPPSQDLLYSSSPSNAMSVTSVIHEASSTSNSTATSTTKRTAPDEYAEGSSSRSSKKNRKSRMVVIADDKTPPAAEKQPVSSSSMPVQQKEVEKQSASQPPSTTVKPPAPPRSPSPPHDLHKPAIPSPLCPVAAAPCIPSRPSLSRRRSRSSEIALLKFALDPWLRLSRSLDGSKPVGGPGCKQAFNPATFPSAGNLRELRMSRSCASTFSSNFGNSYDGFELSLPFNFGGATSDITFGFGNGDLAGGVKWNLVDA